MIVSVSRDGGIRLLSPEDFKRFSVVIDAPPAAMAELAGRIAASIRLTDEKTAWVDIETLKSFPDLASPERRAQFDEMVAKAAPHGWVSVDGLAIKSHVEWQA